MAILFFSQKVNIANALTKQSNFHTTIVMGAYKSFNPG